LSDPLLEAIRFSATGSNSALLAPGATGASVVLVQQALRAWGFASLAPPRDLLPDAGADGDYGTETASAVKVVQTEVGVDPDGMLGPVTLGFLDSHIPGNGGASDVDISADDHLVGPAVPGGQPGGGCPNGGIVDCSALGNDSLPVLVATRISTAREFVRQAIEDLPAPGDVSTPAGRAFANLFGRPDADNVPRVQTRVEQVAQVLNTARLREADPSADPVVVCARDCHPTCQLPATAFHTAANRSIGLCSAFFEKDILPAIAALLHEVTHAALPGETDIYSDARLFNLLATIDVTENGATISAGENNTDSIVSYVLRANGATKGDSTTRGAPPRDQLAFPEGERAREAQARAALAFATEWILTARTTASRVRIALDGLTEATWPADERLTGTRNLIHLLRQFNALQGVTQEALDDPANCQDATRFDFACPAIGSPTNLAHDRAEALRIVTTYDDSFRTPLEQPYRIFPVGPKPGGAAVDWVLDQRMLALFDRFFLLADRPARTRELLLALAREQGLGVGDSVAFVSFAQEQFDRRFPDF
jgi:peptidoglycan hydrolase-like protein with peptidoglycan-binding domain